MMLKKWLKISSVAPLIATPLIAISCTPSHQNEDQEIGLNLREPAIIHDDKLVPTFNHEITKKMYNLYENDLTNLFSEVKENYRQYRLNFLPLKRNLDMLRKKIYDLAIEQKIKEDQNALFNYYNEWLQDDIEAIKNKAASLMFKYTLVFQDVDAVLSNINLEFESNKFVQYLITIDDRLSGKEVNLSTLQNAIISTYKFLLAHIWNENHVTSLQNIENQNIGADRNSHSHSHALINLTYELGLWQKQIYQAIDDNQINNFKNDYQNAKEHIIDNVNHVETDRQYEGVLKVMEYPNDIKDKYNLANPDFKNKANQLVNIFKNDLLKVAASQGIEEIIRKNFDNEKV
ncbi:hypothetical protein FJO69_02670 [[Mycoplasma] falconis]|uniref:Lipoprotein n=1 Tax=[Mycoplasma] falconis TaxID=92403 RepID=A0A501X955_9BACT|nr:hypothetical protein [[Mycoplasma] falconis]TPE56924.1 hypothetical protein FJO69_02670 [[Mycoplasma] falconis]